ncbi:MAG: DNA helicase RecQ [Treponema sp.]|nr:DNA helicase RecQ [Treponema sp.]
MTGDTYTILKTVFGYTGFRRGQEEVIDAILASRDVLAVMPTGAGKSLCYQIPALMLKGLTVVISPLISLMKDQVDALTSAGLKAAYLNSSLSSAEYTEVIHQAAEGTYTILYIAPERLLKADLRRIAETRSVPLVVIDEAHCVSQWGHDFRPSYLQIAEFIGSFHQRPITAAFTATATLKVKEDILRALELRKPFTITTGFDRENLYFEVQRPQDKFAALLQGLKTRKHKSGIVYCATRKTVEEVWQGLRDQGFAVTRYHAGLEDQERHENQDDFLYDRKTVMVATNAFGMGIDKSNVSFVIHYNMPKNIESYYQEAGRAGRDGEAADCILFYSGEDVRINQYLIKNTREEERDEARIAHKLELLKAMTFYATGTECLRGRLRSYFGEQPPAYCGHCSNCQTQFEEIDITLPAQKIISCVFRLKQRGRSFGKIMIIDILRGHTSEKIKTLGLDTLSTWGIMADMTVHRIRVILDYLIEKNYLVQEGQEYPVVEASDISGEIIFAKKRLTMMLPTEQTPQSLKSGARKREKTGKKEKKQEPVKAGLESADEPDGSWTSYDNALFANLKVLRNQFAEASKVPAYIIFTDASLRDMCRKRPISLAMFREVIGVGDVKNERYGPAFIALIREYTPQ